jgi:hypothetical protein
MQAGGPRALHLRPGERVEVRSEAEILATLDGSGTVDGLPFMPEMRRFCGRRFTVGSRADRTVVQKIGVRRMTDAVHLEDLRCDGTAHDGCSRGCLIFWKEAWLKRLPAARSDDPPLAPARALPCKIGGGYFCQATHLDRATTHQPLFDLGQFLRAPAAEGLSPLVLLHSVGILAYDYAQAARRRLGLGGHKEWNSLSGPCRRTPAVSLGLRPGERVRVKCRREILATLNAKGWNRGMEFSREMLPYCGRVLTVLQRVDRILLDQATKMIEVKDTVILEGAVYQALNRRAVPRREHMFWRECWLERV